MSDLKFDVSFNDLPGFRANAVWKDSVFKVVADVCDLRRLRSAMVEMGRIAAHGKNAILILDEPHITYQRLTAEWEGIRNLFQPHILELLTLYIRCGAGDWSESLGRPLTAEEEDVADEVLKHERQKSPRPPRSSSEAFFDILRVLVVHWFRKTGPLTSKELAEQTGFSYPTIARALAQLQPGLIRHSDRRVELSAFPKEAWFKLLAQADKARASRGFTVPSGRPRPPEVLLERLRELKRDDIAVAGVFGARHYLPGLDLAGTPRLDLVMHTRGIDAPPIFLRRLDPALKPVERGEPPQVVIHTLYRPEPLFTRSNKGEIWADEAECLLDLHEMRLEPQALEFVERLTPKPKP